MKGIILDLGTAKKTAEFKKIVDTVIPQLISTNHGATLIAMLAYNEAGVDQFVDTYCKKVEASFSGGISAKAGKEYANSVLLLRDYANKYASVREYLTSLSDTLSQAKAEKDSPEYLQKILQGDRRKDASRCILL